MTDPQPIPDGKVERLEVMLREATAYVAAQEDLPANSRHWNDRERRLVEKCAEHVARFALNILDLKTQSVAKERDTLLERVRVYEDALKEMKCPVCEASEPIGGCNVCGGSGLIAVARAALAESSHQEDKSQPAAKGGDAQ